MKSIVLLVATSLVLVIAMVAVAPPNAVQADNITKYCIDGGPFCSEKKVDCKALLVNTTDSHKCLEVTIG